MNNNALALFKKTISQVPHYGFLPDVVTKSFLTLRLIKSLPEVERGSPQNGCQMIEATQNKS
jgi:hypothetical protein